MLPFILQLAQLAAKYAPAVAAAVPGKMEHQYRQDIEADRARLAGGNGGMSAGQRGRLTAEAMGGIQTQTNEALANLARGANSEAGYSGVQQQAMGDLQRASQGAGLQAASGIRDQDLASAEAQRQGLNQRMITAIAAGQARKNATLQQFQQAGGGQGVIDQFSAMGQGKRAPLGASVDAATTSAVTGG